MASNLDNSTKPENDSLEAKLEELDLEDEVLEKNYDEDYIDEVALKDDEVGLTTEDLEVRKETALAYKVEGNTLFNDNKYTEARSKYTAALRLCPLEFTADRSVLYGNRGACSMKEGRRKEAIQDCSSALELNPLYMKALKRRAVLHEEDDKLDESLEDYKKILELNRNDSEAHQAVQRLPEKILERNEKLKTQMLGTLKDLGNKLLSPFGLSTNNFQLNQDPASGGYTINFNQNKS